MEELAFGIGAAFAESAPIGNQLKDADQLEPESVASFLAPHVHLLPVDGFADENHQLVHQIPRIL